MYTRITEENTSSLEKGTLVCMYPITGPSEDEYSDVDPKRIQEYQVNQVWDHAVDLSFPLPARQAVLGLMPVSMGALHKNFKDLVHERRWWIKTK
jgi:hypothetical protein